MSCVGAGSEGKTCLPHHNVKLLDDSSAWTRCAAEPSDAPPCGLAVEWSLAKKTQRSIWRVYCQTDEAADEECGFMIVPSAGGLQLTCSL